MLADRGAEAPWRRRVVRVWGDLGRDRRHGDPAATAARLGVAPAEVGQLGGLTIARPGDQAGSLESEQFGGVVCARMRRRVGSRHRRVGGQALRPPVLTADDQTTSGGEVRMARVRAMHDTAKDEPSLSLIWSLEFAGTCIEDVPDDVIARLLVRSNIREVEAGRSIFPLADREPRIGLVLMGTARSFLTAADGRQLTVRYARRGAIVGKQSTLVGAHPPLAVQALTDCTVLEFDAEVFATCAATEISLSGALNLELRRRLDDVYANLGESAFGSIRQRLIRHLLALATEIDVAEAVTVHTTQQQLANAIGSPREVVARELGRLRLDGLIRTDRGQIELLNVDRLVSMLNSWQPESPY